MAKEFKGFRLVSDASACTDNQVLYFVRTKGDKNNGLDGYLQFDGKKYGTGENIMDIIGELPSGFTTVIEYIESIKEESLSAINVNGVDAEISGNTASVTITSDDINVGTDIEYSGETIATSADTITDAIGTIVEKIVENEETTAAALNDLNDRIGELEGSSIESADSSITIDTTTEGKTDISVNVEESTADTVAAGHAAVKKNDNGALYAVMFYDGDDVNE